MALAQFIRQPEQVQEIRLRLGLDWRSLVKGADVFSRKDQDQLDDLQELLPTAGATFETWIRRAVESGLLEDETADRMGKIVYSLLI